MLFHCSISILLHRFRFSRFSRTQHETDEAAAYCTITASMCTTASTCGAAHCINFITRILDLRIHSKRVEGRVVLARCGGGAGTVWSGNGVNCGNPELHVVLFIAKRQSRVHVTCHEATKLEKSKADRGNLANAGAEDEASGDFVNPLGRKE